MTTAMEQDHSMERIMSFVLNSEEGTVKPKFDAPTATKCLDYRDHGAEATIIFSFIGPMRSAKSFAACLFHLYLKFKEENPEATGEDFIESNPKIDGVHFEKSDDSVTQGMELLKRPYIITTPTEGKRVAVSVVDCQGLLNTESNYLTIDALIVACALSMSTIPILNVQGTLKGSDLESLKNSLSFLDKKKFDFLQLLHRDWQGNSPLGPQQDEKTSKLKQKLAGCFEDVHEYMVPPPGKTVRDASEGTHVFLKELMNDSDSKEMIQWLVKFFDHILEESMKKKYWKTYEDVVKIIQHLGNAWSGDIAPLQNPREIAWSNAMWEDYEKKVPEMDRIFDGINVETFSTEEDLNAKLEEAKTESREVVNRERPKPEETRQAVIDKVENKIDDFLQRQLKENEEKIQQKFRKYKADKAWLRDMLVALTIGAATSAVGLLAIQKGAAAISQLMSMFAETALGKALINHLKDGADVPAAINFLMQTLGITREKAVMFVTVFLAYLQQTSPPQ